MTLARGPVAMRSLTAPPVALRRAWANVVVACIGDHRDFSRNSAACVHMGGAVWEQALAPMGYPTPVGRCALRRVARSAEHSAVADGERRTASGERYDVVDGQIACGVGGAPVLRAPVPMLATPSAEDAGAEPLPCPRAVQGVVTTAVGLASMLGAATTGSACGDAADRAQLHGAARLPHGAGPTHLTLVTLDCTHVDIAMSVSADGGGVYSPPVLRLGATCRGSRQWQRR